MQKLKIGIIGAGRMGRIRAHSATLHPQCELAAIVDTNLAQARSLAAEVGCVASASVDWAELIRREDISAVVVSTPHKCLAPITSAALEEGKHVLCEKPGARNAVEAEEILRALYGAWPPGENATFPQPAKHHLPRLVIGFTLRHHRAVARARALLRNGEIGKPMYLIGRYGHGGRPGYGQEWRHVPDLSGGGELLDQGVHLIDLSRWFLGEFEDVAGFVGNYFWGSKDAGVHSGVEDNAFLLLRSAEGCIASLQASWTQWKNLFALDVHGEDGFLQVQGLGGSYGEEKLILGRRRPEGGPPEVQEIDLQAGAPAGPLDDVWAREWHSFVNQILNCDNDVNVTTECEPASAIDAWEALRIVEAAYRASCKVPVTTINPAGAGKSEKTLIATS